jgi:hypothetical protein
MQLFLDTNVYLGFFRLTGDDLEELHKLVVAVRSGETNLYLTQQVRDEFRRNRKKVIAESLKSVESSKLPAGFPRLLQNYPEFEELRQALTTYEEHRGHLLTTVREAAAQKELHADGLIQELFKLAQDVPMSPEIWNAAQQRYDLGNPPGKNDSYGDAINWESLIAAVPVGEDLLFVSADTDFASALEPGLLADALRSEWADKKDTAITLYKNLTALFRAHYPDIRLATELEKELAVGKLIGSESFLDTHEFISDVATYTDFSAEQAQALINAANRNLQIYWIREDSDVRAFFTRVAHDYQSVIDEQELDEFWAYFRDLPDDDEDDW